MAYTNQDLINAVLESKSLSQTARTLGFKAAGNNFYLLKLRIEENKIDTSHFGQVPRGETGQLFIKKPWMEVLNKKTENGLRLRSKTIRMALIDSGRKYECSKCPNKGEWLGQPLRLHVDHIDGNCSNNSVENLQFLCPNCHGLKTYPIKRKIDGRSLLKQKPWLRRVERPLKEDLEKLIKDFSMLALGKRFGVSDNAIRKWCQSYQIKFK